MNAVIAWSVAQNTNDPTDKEGFGEFTLDFVDGHKETKELKLITFGPGSCQDKKKSLAYVNLYEDREGNLVITASSANDYA